MRMTALMVTMLAGLFGCAHTSQGPPPTVVPEVEVAKYLGTWYEIASYPARFQKGCVATKVVYTPREDGDISVYNECRKGSLDGPLSSITGKAWVSDPATNAKLKVRFFWPFSSPYWIVALAPDYSHAVVSTPSRKYLWILSRTPTMDEATYDAIVDQLVADGFDTTKLVRTLQVEE